MKKNAIYPFHSGLLHQQARMVFLHRRINKRRPRRDRHPTGTDGGREDRAQGRILSHKRNIQRRRQGHDRQGVRHIAAFDLDVSRFEKSRRVRLRPADVPVHPEGALAQRAIPDRHTDAQVGDAVG